jgi:hypothetical protein
MYISYNTSYVPPTTLRKKTFLNDDPLNSVVMHGPNAGTSLTNDTYDNQYYFRLSWWKRWTNCVANGWNSFVSGNPGGYRRRVDVCLSGRSMCSRSGTWMCGSGNFSIAKIKGRELLYSLPFISFIKEMVYNESNNLLSIIKPAIYKYIFY